VGTTPRPVFAGLPFVVAVLVGCTRPPTRVAENALEEPEEPTALARPTEGGPLVRIGRVEIERVQSREIRADEHEEVFVIVESGDFGRLFGWTPGGVARLQSELTTSATTRSTLIVAVVRDAAHPFRDGESPVSSGRPSWGQVVGPGQAPVLTVGDGKLRVQIFHDAHDGARFGAVSRLDADADLDVPVHAHDASVEALFIESGDGTMILGDERFAIAPGQVIYVPAGVRHGYVHGAEPLRAWQIYAPPGPEQRFRGASAPRTTDPP